MGRSPGLGSLVILDNKITSIFGEGWRLFTRLWVVLDMPPKLQIRPSKSALPEVGIGHLHVFKASKWFYCINEVESHRSSHRLQLTKSSRLNPKESAKESNDSPNGTELETEAQRGQVTCLKTHNFQVA